MKTDIYALFDPLAPRLVRYIGNTKNLVPRLRKHFSAKDSATRDWVKLLIEQGRMPAYKILQRVAENESKAAETKWINTLCTSALLNKRQIESVNGEVFRIESFVPLESVKQQYIEAVLRYTNNNKRAACKILKIGRQTLYNRLK